ncbi:MAG: Uma2 family endonuclease [Geminicoccaceae bacterium]
MGAPARQTPRLTTVQEFLAWDDGTDMRHELVEGEIVAMNPPVAAHALLVSEVGFALRSRLPAGCRVYTGGGALLPGDDLNYRIPDLAVSCVQSRQRWIEQPRLVVEILSPSTQKFDLTGKLAFYRALASIEEILLVRCDERWCELWQRVGRHWSIENHAGAASLPLRATTGPIPLDELYLPLEL